MRYSNRKTLVALIVLLVNSLISVEVFSARSTPGTVEREGYCDRKLETCRQAIDNDCNSQYYGIADTINCGVSERAACDSAYGDSSDCSTRERLDVTGGRAILNNNIKTLEVEGINTPKVKPYGSKIPTRTINKFAPVKSSAPKPKRTIQPALPSKGKNSRKINPKLLRNSKNNNIKINSSRKLKKAGSKTKGPAEKEEEPAPAAPEPEKMVEPEAMPEPTAPDS